MKRRSIVFFSLMLLLVMLACEFAGINVDLGGEATDEAPQIAPVEVGIDSPFNGASFTMQPIDIAYHASSTDGIMTVELSIDGEVLSSITTPSSDQQAVALRYTWQPTLAGSHTIRVRAQSSVGLWSDYSSAMVTITGDQPPAPQQAQVPEVTKTPEPTRTPEPTATPEGVSIYDIKWDKTKFYYGGNGCGSKELTISAHVTDPKDEVYGVILFLRFVDKESAGVTKWDGGRAMSNKSGDLWSVTLTSNKIPNYTAFEFTIMEFQIVVQDKPSGGSFNRLAKSEVIRELSMERCP